MHHPYDTNMYSLKPYFSAHRRARAHTHTYKMQIHTGAYTHVLRQDTSQIKARLARSMSSLMQGSLLEGLSDLRGECVQMCIKAL